MAAPLGMLPRGPTGRSSGASGTGMKEVQTSVMTPQKHAFYNALMGGTQQGIAGGLGHLSDVAGGGSEAMHSQIEAPAMSQFGSMMGQLGSRFSGMGTGARKSSGFQQATGGAATDLAERLASQRQGLQQNAISQLMDLSRTLLSTPEFETSLIAKKQPFWKELLGSAVPALAGGIGQVGGMMAGKKMGF